MSPRNRARSSPSARERRGRSSVGSRPVGGKAAGRWRALEAAKAVAWSTCRWKALWSAEAAPLDGGAAEAVLAPRGLPGWSRTALGAIGSVRGESAIRDAAENAAHEGHFACSTPEESGSAADEAEAESATSMAFSLGVGLPQGGPAPLGALAILGRRATAVSAAQAARSGIERSSGARVVRRLQTFGEAHLRAGVRGEPRGEPSRGRVARQGGGPVTGAAARACERVRG